MRIGRLCRLAATALFLSLSLPFPALAEYVPPLTDYSYLKDISIADTEFPTAKGAAIPVSYDLVPLGLVTPVANQRRLGTCWDFAALEALESSLLKETGIAHDLSELQLGYFAYVDESPDKPAYTIRVPAGSTEENRIFDNGGHAGIARALLSRGTGPAFEADAPYPTYDFHDIEAWVNYVPDPIPYAPARFRLRESLEFLHPGDVKQALMTYGALQISINSASIVSRDVPYAYDPYQKSINHAVLLVGWDDDFPREHFKTSMDVTPTNNGAWKFQNSWGTERDGRPMGDHGYYWISYEDGVVLKNQPANSFRALPLESWDGIYFHDPLGYVNSLPLNAQKISTANVFTATRDERLVGVGFHIMNANARYEIQIVRDIPEDGTPSEGVPAFETPVGGRAGATGYRTHTFDSPVILAKGQRFAVVVTVLADALSTPSDQVVLPLEIKYRTISDKVTAERGEGYIDIEGEGEGEWLDLLDLLEALNQPLPYEPIGSNTIKAFTTAYTPEPVTTSSSGGCGTGAFAALLLLSPAFALGLRKRNR